MKATIYVADWKLWERARAHAIKHGMSLSHLIMLALRDYLEGE